MMAFFADSLVIKLTSSQLATPCEAKIEKVKKMFVVDRRMSCERIYREMFSYSFVQLHLFECNRMKMYRKQFVNITDRLKSAVRMFLSAKRFLCEVLISTGDFDR